MRHWDIALVKSRSGEEDQMTSTRSPRTDKTLTALLECPETPLFQSYPDSLRQSSPDYLENCIRRVRRVFPVV